MNESASSSSANSLMAPEGDASFAGFHRANFETTYSSSYTVPPGHVVVDGSPTTNEVLITLQKQIPVRLDLPFLTFPMPPPTHDLPRCRNLRIMESARSPVLTDGVSAEQFLTETIPKIRLPND